MIVSKPNFYKMNKDYLQWFRKLRDEKFFIDFGGLHFSAHRQHFLQGLTPSESAFWCVPW
jgi:hypothetical protein